jgi:Transcriptional regulators
MQNDPTNQLYNALSRLGRQIHRMEHWMAHGDMLGQKLYRGQPRLLSLISQNNGASQRDLAEEMDVRPSSMTEMLLRMEQAGLITRKQDETDQRVMRIFLTEAGEKAAEQSGAATLDLTTTIFNCLTQEEQAQMLTLIEKISAGIVAIAGPDAPDTHHHWLHHGHHGRHGQHHWPFCADGGNQRRHF